MSPDEQVDQRIATGEMVAAQFKRFCRPLGISSSTGVEIERNYLELLDLLTRHLDEQPYFLGGRPCMGDFSIHGMIYAHLIRDARTGFVTKSRAPLVSNWCERMRGYAKEHPLLDRYVVDENRQLVKANDIDLDFLSNDAIAPTLLPILKRVISDFVEPILIPATEQLDRYARQNPAGGLLPKPLMGKEPISVRIGATKTTRMCNPFDIYRLQDCHRIIAENPLLADFVELIDPNGAIAQCRVDGFKLARIDNKLHLVPTSDL